ncbi:MAG: hypothetical protein ACJ74U_12825 [Jatrophihabitantaceae bacterium]
MTVVEDAIRAAQTQVEAYLRRKITPVQFVQTGCIDYADGWRLDWDPVVEIVSATPEVHGDGQPTGLYTVTYTAGYDVTTGRHGADHRLDQGRRPGRPGVVRLMAANGQRLVRSVSAEGQSVSYESTPSTDKVPTAGVRPMSTMDYWRKRSVYKREAPTRYPHRGGRWW